MRKLGAAALLLLVACSPRGGEGWAKKYLGEDGAERLRSEGSAATFGRGGVTGKPGALPYLPRPYVMLQIPNGEWRPFFHDANLQIEPPPSSEAAVKGIAVVQVEFHVDNKPGISRQAAGAQRVPHLPRRSHGEDDDVRERAQPGGRARAPRPPPDGTLKRQNFSERDRDPGGGRLRTTA